MKIPGLLTPPTPRSFHNRIVTTIKELDDMKNVKRAKFSVALAAALIALALLASLAYAAQTSGLLSALFGASAPTPEAQAMLNVSGETASHNSVTFTLDEYLIEGNTLHLRATLTSENDEALLCAVSFPEIEGRGMLGGMFTSGVGLDQFVPLKKGEPVEFIMSATLDGETEPNAEYTLSLSALAIRATAPVEPYTYTRGGVTYTVYDICTDEIMIKRAQSPDKPLGEILTEAGISETVAELSLSVSAVHERPARGEKPEATYEFEDYTLKILNLDFGATVTRVEFHIYPKRGGAEAALASLYARRYKLLDEEGRDITLGVAGGWESAYMRDDEEAEGDKAHICFLGDWGPLPATESVTLMPYADGVPITEEAITVIIGG